MTTRRFAWLAALSLLLTGLSPRVGLADGGFFPPADYRGEQLREPAQRAVLVHAGGKQTTVLFVDYAGGARHFAWLVPCPTEPKVAVADSRIFSEVVDFYYRAEVAAWKKRLRNTPGAGAGGLRKSPVTVLRSQNVGPYEIAVVAATQAGALRRWLQQNNYRIPDGMTAVLEAYVREKWYFAAVKVRLTRGSQATLKPLRLDFASKRPVYPLRISAAVPGVSRVLVYVVQPAGAALTDPAYNARPSGEEWDFRGMGKACPQLARLRPELNWRKLRLEKVAFDAPPQLMRAHNDRTLRPGVYATAVGVAEAWISMQRDEAAWAEANLHVYGSLGRRRQAIPDDVGRLRVQIGQMVGKAPQPVLEQARRLLQQRQQATRPQATRNPQADRLAKLKQFGRRLGEPLYAKIRARIDRSLAGRTDELYGDAACAMLVLLGDQSKAALQCLERAAASQSRGLAATNALHALGTRGSREALVRVARSKGPHATGAWFRYTYSVAAEELSPTEQRSACRHLIDMLASKAALGDAQRNAKALLKYYAQRDFGDDWDAWRKWNRAQAPAKK